MLIYLNSMKLVDSMAPVMGNTQRPKKRKATSSAKTTHRALKRKIRRISSSESEQHQRRNQLPSTNQDEGRPARTFYQPAANPQHRTNSDDDEEEEEEEEGGGVSALSDRLPEDKRYKAMGKIFALKIWPWPSPGWWISNIGTGNQTRANQTTDLDAKMRDKFITFLGFDMGMSTEEWMRPGFMQAVSFSSPHLDATLLTST
jgi:hypothetical protein